MLGTLRSVSGALIRLTANRWAHTTEEHCELAGHSYEVLETIGSPEAVYQGSAGELLAARQLVPGKFLVVVYREQTAQHGFVITAFLTRRIRQLEKGRKVRPR
jgi:hypothetical protein